MKVKELMDSLKGDCYRFRVHYPEEWEFEDEQAPKMKPFGRSKPVRCVETDERFESIRKAAEETGVRKSGIGQAANHKQETAGGYHWEFIEDFFG